MTFPWSSPKPSCVLSECKLYRYQLRIPVSSAPGTCVFVLANPSTAIVENGVFTSDRTITGCIGYTRAWGYGLLIVVNVRAWRETDPEKVPEDPRAIGPDNDLWIERSLERASVVVCGWGKLGGARGTATLELIRKLGVVPHALALNQDGSPAHPLYLKKSLKPFPMVVSCKK